MRWIAVIEASPECVADRALQHYLWAASGRSARFHIMSSHDHDDRPTLSGIELRVRALETLLIEKGYVEAAALDRIVEAHETRIGPHIGARIVAKAWSDTAFRRALLEDATKAAAPFAHEGRVGDHLVAVENTSETHNMVVCTLCSCYPWDVLGLPDAANPVSAKTSLPGSALTARSVPVRQQIASMPWCSSPVGSQYRSADPLIT